MKNQIIIDLLNLEKDQSENNIDKINTAIDYILALENKISSYELFINSFNANLTAIKHHDEIINKLKSNATKETT